MQLVKAQVRDYRSVHDTGEFEIEPAKTLLVGVNEAGKTAVLRALQTINPPEGTDPLDPLRDFPRARFAEVQSGQVQPADICVATATFALGDDERDAIAELHPELRAVTHLNLFSYMSNKVLFSLVGVPGRKTLGPIEKDLARFKAHLAKREDSVEVVAGLDAILKGRTASSPLEGAFATKLDGWLDEALPIMDESDDKEEERFDRIRSTVRYRIAYLAAYSEVL